MVVPAPARPGPGGQGRASKDLGPRDPCTEQYNDPDVICILQPRWLLGRCDGRLIIVTDSERSESRVTTARAPGRGWQHDLQ